jgi:hypothetical protein
VHAEIITTGTGLLLGETEDTDSTYIRPVLRTVFCSFPLFLVPSVIRSLPFDISAGLYYTVRGYKLRF